MSVNFPLRATARLQGRCEREREQRCSYIAGIPLLAHGLTMKLSPCPCSRSSPPGRIAVCQCGHFKYNLLLTQARPRMIQHLSSTNCKYTQTGPGNKKHGYCMVIGEEEMLNQQAIGIHNI